MRMEEKNNVISSVVFISNYFNHHQKALSESMYQKLGSGYLFIETEQMPPERTNMGWGITDVFPYVVSCSALLRNKKYYESIIAQADIVILGEAPYEFVRQRIKDNKLVYRYSERLLKKGFEIWKYVARFIRWQRYYPNSKCVYLLCASAYTSADFLKFGVFKQKAYKWGYFPEVKQYKDINEVIERKKNNSIVWVSRFIGWKHPEIAVEIGRRLKEDGYSFEINLIGDGEMLNDISDSVNKKGLDKVVHILGAMKPEQVREYMEQSEIFLFTSDRNEGWGAVLNESMNSGCAVVASHAIGSVPFLIEDGKNGLIYKDGNIDELYQKVKWLLDNADKRQKIARNAYETMIQQWNAENAAQRLLTLSGALLNGEKNPEPFNDGVCSKANNLKDNWYTKH